MPQSLIASERCAVGCEEFHLAAPCGSLAQPFSFQLETEHSPAGSDISEVRFEQIPPHVVGGSEAIRAGRPALR